MTDTRSSDFARRALEQAERTACKFPDVHHKAAATQAQETLRRAQQAERNAPGAKKEKL